MTLFSKLFSAFGQSTDKEIISFLNSHKKFKKGDIPTIAHCIPNSFEFYGIITHPFEIATNLSDSLVTLEEFKNRVPYDFELAKQAEPLGISLTMTDKNGRTIDLTQHSVQKQNWHNKQTWRLADWNEVCKKNGIPFNERTTLNSIWRFFSKNGVPYNLNYPDEGTLEFNKFKLICEEISKDSLYNKIYVYQTPPHAITDNDTLMLMSTKDLLKYFEGSGFRGYLCAADKSFFLYADHDLQFSLWGSSKELADRLTKVIEMFPTRLDYKLND